MDRLTALAVALIEHGVLLAHDIAPVAATICAALDAEEKRADEKRLAEDRAAHGARAVPCHCGVVRDLGPLDTWTHPDGGLHAAHTCLLAAKKDKGTGRAASSGTTPNGATKQPGERGLTAPDASLPTMGRDTDSSGSDPFEGQPIPGDYNGPHGPVPVVADPLTILPATRDVVLTNILRDPATEICYCGGEQVLCGTEWISRDFVVHSRAMCYAKPVPPATPPPIPAKQKKPRDKRCRVVGCERTDTIRWKTAYGWFCIPHQASLPREDAVRASEAYDKAKRAAKRVPHV